MMQYLCDIRAFLIVLILPFISGFRLWQKFFRLAGMLLNIHVSLPSSSKLLFRRNVIYLRQADKESSSKPINLTILRDLNRKDVMDIMLL